MQGGFGKRKLSFYRQAGDVALNGFIAVRPDSLGVGPQEALDIYFVRKVLVVFLFDEMQRFQPDAGFMGNGLETYPFFDPDRLKVAPEGKSCLLGFSCHLCVSVSCIVPARLVFDIPSGHIS